MSSNQATTQTKRKRKRGLVVSTFLLLLSQLVVLFEDDEEEHHKKKHRYNTPTGLFSRPRVRLAEQLWLYLNDPLQERLYFTLFRMSHSEVTELASLLHVEDDHTLPPQWKYNSRRRLEVFLHSLSSSSVITELSPHVSWHPNSVHNNMYEMCQRVIDYLDAPTSPYRIKWLNYEQFEQIRTQINEMQQENKDGSETCFGLVGGLYIKVQKSTDPQLKQQLYSRIKNTWCVLFIVICNMQGQIIYVDDGTLPMNGATTEGVAFSRCKEIMPSGLHLLGDNAYSSDSRCKVVTDQLLPHYVVITRLFLFLKNVWRSLSVTWNKDLSRLPLVFRACCLLCNYLFHSRNAWPASFHNEIDTRAGLEEDELQVNLASINPE
jgi:hypothetical protein